MNAETATPMQPHHTARQHKTQRTPAAPLKLFMDDFNIGESELAKALGQAPGTVGQWIKSGDMPAMALIALEALRRRRVDHHVVLMIRPGPKADVVRTVLAALGVEIVEV